MLRMGKFYTAIATGLFSGFLKPAPGTWGTLLGVLIIFLTKDAFLYVKVSIFVIMYILGTISTSYYIRKYKKKDPAEVVIDEIAAVYFIALFVPFSGLNLFLIFLLFRVFDILKPFPIKILERIDGATGIMIDDIMAAVYSILVLRGVVWALAQL